MQITSTPKQFQMEGGSKKSKLKSNFRGIKKAWDNFIKPGLKVATPLIFADIDAKIKNPLSGEITGDIPKYLTGGKFLIITDMHGNGLRLKLMWFYSK